jgi:hypothetical protein
VTLTSCCTRSGPGSWIFRVWIVAPFVLKAGLEGQANTNLTKAVRLRHDLKHSGSGGAKVRPLGAAPRWGKGLTTVYITDLRTNALMGAAWQSSDAASLLSSSMTLTARQTGLRLYTTTDLVPTIFFVAAVWDETGHWLCVN